MNSSLFRDGMLDRLVLLVAGYEQNNTASVDIAGRAAVGLARYCCSSLSVYHALHRYSETSELAATLNQMIECARDAMRQHHSSENQNEATSLLPGADLKQIKAEYQNARALLTLLDEPDPCLANPLFATSRDPSGGVDDCCDWCGETSVMVGPLKKCSVCKEAAFCSKLCQKKSWKNGHKESCSSWKSTLLKMSDADYNRCKLHSRPLTLSHSHTLAITCTCCYDEIKGTQDQELFACSFSDSVCVCVGLVLSLYVCIRISVSLPLIASLSLNHFLTGLKSTSQICSDTAIGVVVRLVGLELYSVCLLYTRLK